MKKWFAHVLVVTMLVPLMVPLLIMEANERVSQKIRNWGDECVWCGKLVDASESVLAWGQR